MGSALLTCVIGCAVTHVILRFAYLAGVPADFLADELGIQKGKSREDPGVELEQIRGGCACLCGCKDI